MNRNSTTNKPLKNVQNKFMKPSNLKLKNGLNKNNNNEESKDQLDKEINSIEDNNALID